MKRSCCKHVPKRVCTLKNTQSHAVTERLSLPLPSVLHFQLRTCINVARSSVWCECGRVSPSIALDVTAVKTNICCTCLPRLVKRLRLIYSSLCISFFPLFSILSFVFLSSSSLPSSFLVPSLFQRSFPCSLSRHQQTVRWVHTEIVKAKLVSTRAEVVSYFLRMAEVLFSLNDLQVRKCVQVSVFLSSLACTCVFLAPACACCTYGCMYVCYVYVCV